jgi:stage II sporulation protein D
MKADLLNDCAVRQTPAPAESIAGSPMKRSGVAALCRLWVFMVVPALLLSLPVTASGEHIKVLIADHWRSFTVEAHSGRSGTGHHGKHGMVRRSIDVTSLPKGGTLRITSDDGFVRVNGKKYRGSLDIRRRPGGRLLVINDLDVEEYLRGVIPAEIPFDWEEEVLKAQAVASRTYALYQKREAGTRPYHVRATVDSQMYLGTAAEHESSSRAVEETRGLVVVAGGEVIPAFYHSSCGGHTENASLLWDLSEPYLRGGDCDCQEISRYGLWEKRFSGRTVAVALRRLGYRVGTIDSVADGEITPAGHVRTVVFGSDRGRTIVPAEALRAALGYSSVPSTFFEPEYRDGDIVLSGRGMGHGVGLCQWGAKLMARKGFDFRSILEYYYPGTTVVRLQEGE